MRSGGRPVLSLRPVRVSGQAVGRPKTVGEMSILDILVKRLLAKCPLSKCLDTDQVVPSVGPIKPLRWGWEGEGRMRPGAKGGGGGGGGGGGD